MPSSLVVKVVVAFLATSTTLTVAPGTAAPFGSATLPLILPRSSWACIDRGTTKRKQNAASAQPASKLALLLNNFMGRILLVNEIKQAVGLAVGSRQHGETWSSA